MSPACGFSGDAFLDRHDVDVEVEHGLSGRRSIELLDQHAVGADRLLDLRRELLHHSHELGEPFGRDGEQVRRLAPW